MEEKFYTVKELIEVLKVSESWLMKRIRNKEIPSYKLGRRRLFKKEDVDRWVEIQGKEDFQKRLKEESSMKGIIERLKKEKAELEHNRFDEGKEEGLEWARAASYSDLKEGLKFADDWQMSEDPGDAKVEIPGWSSYWAEIGEDNITDQFILGWIEGLKAFWKEVESKI